MQDVQGVFQWINKCFRFSIYRFAISLIYYGISFNVGEFGGSVYINYGVSTVAETVAVLLCFFADRFPRKKLLCLCMITGGVACLSTIFTSIFADKCKFFFY
jgi:MFS family permease